MACVALTSLMRTLELEFLQPNPRLILNDKQHIQSLCKKLTFLQTFVDESEKKAHNYCEDLIERIREVTLEAEYEIEAELVEIRHETLDATLKRVLEDIEQLIEMIEARSSNSSSNTAKGLLRTQHLESSSSGGQSKTEDTMVMVGQTKEFEGLKKQLLSSNALLQVMSLVGMGGIGKTTFARKLADDSAVKSHFDCWGWATMSQEHNKRQALLQLCRSVMPMPDDINTMSEGELADQLRKSLLPRRYLIIVDDIWTKDAWDDVKRCFPDEDKGSRILLTTRLKEVSKYACSDNKFIYDMRFLNRDETWNLFSQKFLVKGQCLNKELEEIGMNIVQKCHGLPLAVVVLAGPLSTNLAVDEWKSVKSMLNSFVNLDVSEQYSRILSLSYNNLPCHLKSCFLYLGAFPEDHEIEIKKVIRLWIAEGFIKEESRKTLEESGEDYLQDLINRNLIMATGRSISNGKVETCKMHDLLHDLCANKAKTEKLLCTRDSGGRRNFFTHPSHSIQSDGNRWLSFKIVSQQQFGSFTALNKSRSILCFDMRKWNEPDWYLNLLASKFKMRADSFKMIRVLDLTVLDYNGSIPSDTIDVVLLRYLAVASNSLLTCIPVRRNQNLQTLVICEDINGVLKLPCGIWELPQLRHLELYHQLIPMYTPQVAAQVNLNLQTMYWLQCVQCTKQVFSRIPNVKELGIIAQGCIRHRCLDDLNCLKKLEKLKVEGSYYCPIKLPTHAHAFPQNLKNITFAKTLMPWEAMNIISMLPKLEELKLKNHACLGQEWEIPEEGGFPELKLLIISVTDLEHWKSEYVDCPFPKLERLVLRNCFELREMPSWIEDIKNLKSVQLEHCHASLGKSARKIEEEQRVFSGKECEFEILEFHTQSEENDDEDIKMVIPENDEDIKTSVFLEARSLYIPHENNPQFWSWTQDSGHEVAKLLCVCWLEIKGKLDTRRLLKMTSYSAYLTFKLKPKTRQLDTAFTSVRYIKDKRSYNENRRCQVFLAKRRSCSEDPGRFPNRRHDGWMEIKLGDFYISSRNEGEVEMRLWSTENVHWKYGLIVKGIEVRPNS